VDFISRSFSTETTELAIGQVDVEIGQFDVVALSRQLAAIINISNMLKLKRLKDEPF